MLQQCTLWENITPAQAEVIVDSFSKLVHHASLHGSVSEPLLDEVTAGIAAGEDHVPCG